MQMKCNKLEDELKSEKVKEVAYGVVHILSVRL